MKTKLELPRSDGTVMDLSVLERERAYDEWNETRAIVDSWMRPGGEVTLDTIWRMLEPHGRYVTLSMAAFRGQMHCGVDGIVAWLSRLDDLPKFEQQWHVRRERFGALLGAVATRGVLAEVVARCPPGEVAREVVSLALEERVLRDGEVTDPALTSFHERAPRSWSAHPWERGVIKRAGRQRDTLGNTYTRSQGELRWPDGIDDDASPEVRVDVVHEWGIDEEWDPCGPEGLEPPVGPMFAPGIYPNGHTWCVEADVSEVAHASCLSAWPFPLEHVDVRGVRAERVGARALFREWLWRGLSGGAYRSTNCAASSRELAWSSLARLAGVGEGEPIEVIARAAQELEVYGFRARGEAIDQLGGDLGFVAVRPGGRAFAAAHSDSD